MENQELQKFQNVAITGVRQKRTKRTTIKMVKDQKNNSAVKIFEKFLLFLLFASAATLAWAFYKNKVISNQADIQNQTSPLPRKKEILDLVKRIERHILLPEGETPSIATIVNIDSLKMNPFYANAKNGDKVLIYFNAKKAYIYDEERDLVINTAPVLTENGVASSTKNNSSTVNQK